MDINDRIQKIGKYFKVFNVNNGAVCIGVVFPEKWILFNAETICEEFGVQIQQKDGTTFFLCGIEDGFDPVFNAAEFIIEQNLALEEKTNLLREKADELRKLFENEPLEKLKTLRFVFDSTDDLMNLQNITLPVKPKKTTKTEIPPQEEVKQETNEKPNEKQVKKPRKKNNNDSSLMSFVKDNLENG